MIRYFTLVLAIEGSLGQGLKPKHGQSYPPVTAELVYCLPNLADSKILNKRHLKGRIVMVDRGSIGILEKAIKIQAEEAVGVLVVDNGQCDAAFISCGVRGSGSATEGGFSSGDSILDWKRVNIPVLLITRQTADILHQLMELKTVDVPRLGPQRVSREEL
jgi:hypothetical protein